MAWRFGEVVLDARLPACGGRDGLGWAVVGDGRGAGACSRPKLEGSSLTNVVPTVKSHSVGGTGRPVAARSSTAALRVGLACWVGLV